MNRCYVGVGGIGCRTLKEYENTGAKGRFIYIDAVPADLEHLESGECYALTKQKNGCTQRIIGKDEIRVVIYKVSQKILCKRFSTKSRISHNPCA